MNLYLHPRCSIQAFFPFMLSTLQKYKYILLFIALVVYMAGFLYSGRWKIMLNGGDSHAYYLHVLSFWLYDDVGNYDKSISSIKSIYPKYEDPRLDVYGIRPTGTGKVYIKYPVGVGVMETPFFFLGHAIASLSPKHKEDGWSPPYKICIALGTIVYVLLGLSLLYSVLSRYFSPFTVFISLLSIAIATNLVYQAIFVAMAHSILFFLHSLLIWCTVRLYEKPGKWIALGLGGTIGMITITRVPEIICALVPLLWGVYNRRTIVSRVQFIGQHWKLLLTAIVGFAVVASLQVSYWYYVSGKLFFNPYAGEALNLAKSHFIDGWFHFRNGWLIYTPVMAFSLLGWFFMRKYAPQALVPTVLFVLINAYVHYSWYAWTYFPGFGSRPMVECYPLLSFALASFFFACTQKKMTKWLPVTILVLFAGLNLFQTWQQLEGIMYSEGGKKAFYLASFGKTKHTPESLRSYDSGERQPDTNDLVLVKMLVTESFEDSMQVQRSDSIRKSGVYSVYDPNEFPFGQNLPMGEVRPGDWVKVGVSGFILPEDLIQDRDKSAALVFQLMDEKGEIQKWTSIAISRYLGNPTYSFWSAGAANVWGEASFYIQIPRSVTSEWRMNAGVWNPNHQRIFLDDFYVGHYVEK